MSQGLSLSDPEGRKYRKSRGVQEVNVRESKGVQEVGRLLGVEERSRRPERWDADTVLVLSLTQSQDIVTKPRINCSGLLE